MKNNVLGYFEGLGTLFRNILVTDHQGISLDLVVGIETAINLIVSQTSQGYKAIFIGNGGSASIASHQATDFCKNGGMRAIAFNDPSLLTCLGNDFGYQHVFEKPIEMFADPGDILIAISSSGRSENILMGVNAAKEKRCQVITMSGFASDNRLWSMGNLNFFVPSDSYGFVEIVHLAICHCILDSIIAQNRKDAKIAKVLKV